MFERFTDRARRIIVLAQEEARATEYDYIGPEHMLLAARTEEEGIAAQVLKELDVSAVDIEEFIIKNHPDGMQCTSGHMPFTPIAKTCMELALREALQLGHNYIGTEHVLLGIMRGDDNPAHDFLVSRGISLLNVRTKIIEHLAAEYKAKQPEGESQNIDVALDDKEIRTIACRISDEIHILRTTPFVVDEDEAWADKLEEQIYFYLQGYSHTLPREWEIYTQDLDPAYSLYLRLKARFEPKDEQTSTD